MSVRGVFAAFAVLGIVEASLVIPHVSQAGQLADTAAAATINGSMHSLNNTNIHAPDRARALARQADEYRGYGGQAGTGGAAQRGPGTKQAPVTEPGSKFDEKSAQKGKPYSTDGTVVFDGMAKKGRIILVVRIDGPNKFQLMGYRPADPNMPQLPDKAQVTVSGVYVGKIKEPQTGSLIHGFDKAVFSVQGAAGPEARPQAQPQAEEKPTFSSVLKGWVFRGTAQVDGRATGVFVNDQRVKYAQPGEQLEEGIKVRSVSNGAARVSVDDKNLELMPW